MDDRPTLPSIHSLLGLANRDELRTMLDRREASHPLAEHDDTSPSSTTRYAQYDHYSDTNDTKRARKHSPTPTPGETAQQPSGYSFNILQPTGPHGRLTVTSSSSSPASYLQSPYSASYAYTQADYDSHLHHEVDHRSAVSAGTPGSGRPRQSHGSPPPALVERPYSTQAIVLHPAPIPIDASTPSSSSYPALAQMAQKGKSSVPLLIDERGTPADLGGRLMSDLIGARPSITPADSDDPSSSARQAAVVSGGKSGKPNESETAPDGSVVHISPTTSVFPATAPNIAKYLCEYCQKRFNRPSSLKIHVNTHTGDKPYPCTFPGCGRCFSVLSNMRRHARVHAQSRHHDTRRQRGQGGDDDDDLDDDEGGGGDGLGDEYDDAGSNSLSPGGAASGKESASGNGNQRTAEVTPTTLTARGATSSRSPAPQTPEEARAQHQREVQIRQFGAFVSSGERFRHPDLPDSLPSPPSGRRGGYPYASGLADGS